MKARVGVVLSGCGVHDGSEIHEAVITLLAIDRGGAQAICAAPDVDQRDVFDHLKGAPSKGERRNVLVESARIARGAVRDVGQLAADDVDAVVLPGGFGAAKNLCDFALRGPECTIEPTVERFLRAVHAAKKPIGAVCIAPAIVARLFGSSRPRLTIGSDASTAAALERMGARHEDCRTRGIVVDREHRIVSTPAYMLAQSIGEAAEGIESLVAEILTMTRERTR